MKAVEHAAVWKTAADEMAKIGKDLSDGNPAKPVILSLGLLAQTLNVAYIGMAIKESQDGKTNTT